MDAYPNEPVAPVARMEHRCALKGQINRLDQPERAYIGRCTDPYRNQYPRIFQAWNRAENLAGEDPIATMSRHDLCFTTPEGLSLQSDNKYPGLATGYTKQSVNRALQKRQQLLQKNPRMIILASIQYRDAFANYFPADSDFWQRDGDGRATVGWKDAAGTRSCWKIDFCKPEVQDAVVRKCLATIAAGVVDGIMLDWWNDGTSDASHNQARLHLLRKIRSAIGPDALILVNANDIRGDGDTPNARLLKQSAPLVNGVFMESVQSFDSATGTFTYTRSDWRNIEKALEWNEANLRQPKVNCLEIWWQSSRCEEKLMRAATTLALTRSNGYALFADPNRLPTVDHLHNWYPFWNKSLGRPLQAAQQTRKDGASVREFENGTAVYNSILNPGPITITFAQGRMVASESDAQPEPAGTTFVIPPGDGDLFLRQ